MDLLPTDKGEVLHDKLGAAISACMAEAGYDHENFDMSDGRCVDDVDFNPYCNRKGKRARPLAVVHLPRLARCIRFGSATLPEVTVANNALRTAKKFQRVRSRVSSVSDARHRPGLHLAVLGHFVEGAALNRPN